MIVDTRPEREIKEEGNQVQLGKQRQETPSTVAMSPTTQWLDNVPDMRITI